MNAWNIIESNQKKQFSPAVGSPVQEKLWTVNYTFISKGMPESDILFYS